MNFFMIKKNMYRIIYTFLAFQILNIFGSNTDFLTNGFTVNDRNQLNSLLLGTSNSNTSSSISTAAKEIISTKIETPLPVTEIANQKASNVQTVTLEKTTSINPNKPSVTIQKSSTNTATSTPSSESTSSTKISRKTKITVGNQQPIITGESNKATTPTIESNKATTPTAESDTSISSIPANSKRRKPKS